MAGALEGDLFVGPKAQEHRGLLNIRYPMEHGIVTDWNDMERIWQYIYSKDQLHTFSEEHPVLLTEAPLNPRRNREKAAEIFFETFNVPALFLINASYSGDGVTHAVPIYEGFALPHSVMRVDVAGRDVTRHLKLLLRKEGVNFRTTAEFEIKRALDTERHAYTLPDGSSLEIGPARFRAPEVLFRPDLIGEECEGLHECLVFCILKSDMDLRKVLFQNIVLSGGSTLFKGFGDRLLSEVKKFAPKDIKIRISAPQERLYSTWIGGSILASLDTFKKMWVAKREYDEEGHRAIHRKNQVSEPTNRTAEDPICLRAKGSSLEESMLSLLLLIFRYTFCEPLPPDRTFLVQDGFRITFFLRTSSRKENLSDIAQIRIPVNAGQWPREAIIKEGTNIRASDACEARIMAKQVLFKQSVAFKSFNTIDMTWRLLLIRYLERRFVFNIGNIV
ncbi:ACTR1 [Lepeophtheirus salmonis]|uniref:ACTR1 n=1 Tax=Lepeophtheirus salmonis TaxID=72036 RepID=A0A7R8CFC5_LEPSM|nr:ACTR1 [Lepeophtheirus salmonis]CAF2805048.1 ACTR1 [Lepeophtheirus salmonis]